MEMFVTCGQGLEGFGREELRDKFNITPSVAQHPGKLFFTKGETSIEELLRNLKTVERLFGVVVTLTHEQIPHFSSSHQLLNFIFNLCSEPRVKQNLEEWNLLRNEEVSPLEEPVVKRQKGIGFRINVKLSGIYRGFLEGRTLSKSIGSALIKTGLGKEGWFIELRRPQVELSFYLTNEGLILAIPLSVKPISERTYLRHIPLRATVAEAMGSVLLKHTSSPDEPLVFMDPFSGSSVILIEMAKNRQNSVHLMGMDKDESQLNRGMENVIESKVEGKVSLLKGDSFKRIPVRTPLDGIVSDLPFGIQHGGTQEEVKESLPIILHSMNAALKPNGVVVLLMSEGMTQFLETQVTEVRWTLLEKFPLKLGELPANILAFRKEN